VARTCVAADPVRSKGSSTDDADAVLAPAATSNSR
jgi:hypothetical protein